MSGYSKWDKFDPDLVCKEIDVQQAVESSKQAKKKAFQNKASENEQNIINARKKAEALQAQADVAALKAKGMGGRRKRDKDASATVEPAVSDNIYASTGDAVHTEQKSVAEKLNLITDFLFKLLKQVELIRTYTEQNRSHEQGYHAAINCLHDISKFSRIKNATVLAALRASSTDGVGGSQQAPMKIIQDLNESESFLVDQTVNCLCLFALSRGEYAVASDASRYVLKRQGSLADAGIWIMRGLAFAGMGVPFLTKLHFTSAVSVNADYAGLQSVMSAVEAAAQLHARQASQSTKPDLVSRELLRCMRTFFTSRAHILKAVPDLAVIGVAEVNNFLAEGSLWQDDLFSSLQLEDSAVKATVLNGEACMAESIHMDEATDSAKNPDSGGAPDIPVSALVHALQRQVCELLKMKTTGDSPAGVLLSRLQKDFSCDKGAHCPQEKVSLYAALAGLHLCRRLFYEAQMLYLEAFYQSAEVKYAATLLLIEAVKNLLKQYTEGTSSAPSKAEEEREGAVFPHQIAAMPLPVLDIADYLTQLAAACYINTSVCLVQHTITLKLLQPAHSNGSSMESSADPMTAPHAVSDVVGDASLLSSPLEWCRQGLALCDTLPARLRLLIVLEKMHRFREGLAECEKMQALVQQKTENAQASSANNSLVGPKEGSFSLLPVAEHTLSQQFTAGCMLPMPVSCLLDLDMITLTEAEAAAGELDFEKYLTKEQGGTAEAEGVVASDTSVGPNEWLNLLQTKAAHFDFQIRKYG